MNTIYKRGMNTYQNLNKFKFLCANSVDRLQCVDYELDSAGGPPLDSLTFKFIKGGKSFELLMLTGFYGTTYKIRLVPNSSFVNFDVDELTKGELEYIWECHKAAGLYI